jgi:hypothetical protein
MVWPSGWAWHSGAPYQSDYFMMIVGLYATLSVFLLNAARNPQANLSLTWFTAWSSVVLAAIMAVQSFGSGHHMGHLAGMSRRSFGGRCPVDARAVVPPQAVCCADFCTLIVCAVAFAFPRILARRPLQMVAAANHIDDPDQLPVGEVVFFPSFD